MFQFDCIRVARTLRPLSLSFTLLAASGAIMCVVLAISGKAIVVLDEGLKGMPAALLFLTLMVVFLWVPRRDFLPRLIDGPFGVAILRPRLREAWISARAFLAATLVTIPSLAVATVMDRRIFGSQILHLLAAGALSIIAAVLLVLLAKNGSARGIKYRGLAQGRIAPAVLGELAGARLVPLLVILRQRIGIFPKPIILFSLVSIATSYLLLANAGGNELGPVVGFVALFIVGLVACHIDASLARFVAQQPFSLFQVFLWLASSGLFLTFLCGLVIGAAFQKMMFMWCLGVFALILTLSLFAYLDILHLLTKGRTARLAAQIDQLVIILASSMFAPLGILWSGFRAWHLSKAADKARWYFKT